MTPVVPLAVVALGADTGAALAEIPVGAGVGQIRGPEGRSLLIGRPASLRRWAASHLGAGRPPRKGQRPRTDLRPLATAIAYAATSSGFRQRLLYERLMARHVPPAARRDLRPPAFLHLDPRERFPRVTVRGLDRGRDGLFGPFRNRAAAERARQALHKVFPLRPCDYLFEPATDLPLGLGCVYAQVRTCAAPCLVRVTEEDYRSLAAEAASFLAGGAGRPEADWLPAWIGAVPASRGLVVAVGREGMELDPVWEGAVLEVNGVTTREEELAEGLARLRWEAPSDPYDDWPWLSAWLHDPRGRGTYLPVEDPDDTGRLLEQTRRALAGLRP